jgi:hypothetical protein
MQKEKKKTADNTLEDELTKVQDLSEEVSEFIEVASESKDIIEYLMENLDSLRRRPDPAHDNKERAMSKGRMVIALMALLAEKTEELRDDATSYKETVEKIVNR